MQLYYNREGEPITLAMYAELHSGEMGRAIDYLRVAEDHIGEFRISTVWLGVDHSFGMGPPLIFETMIFDDGIEPGGDVYIERYATEADALAGHQDAIAWLQERLAAVKEDLSLDAAQDNNPST